MKERIGLLHISAYPQFQCIYTVYHCVAEHYNFSYYK